MKVKIASPIRFYNGEKLVGESDYNGNAFTDPHIEITEDDIVKGYKAAGDEIVKAWSDFDGYLKRHPEIWRSLADKLCVGFVDYKDVPLGDKEILYEQKN